MKNFLAPLKILSRRREDVNEKLKSLRPDKEILTKLQALLNSCKKSLVQHKNLLLIN